MCYFPIPRRLALTIAAAGLLSGILSCSSLPTTPLVPQQLYSGPRLAPEKVATLAVASSRDMLKAFSGVLNSQHVSGFAGTKARVFITQVNSSAVGPQGKYGPIEILPGNYVATVGCEADDFAGGIQQVKFNALPGQQYIAEIVGANIVTEVGENVGGNIKCTVAVKAQ